MNKREIKFRFWDVDACKMLYPKCGIQDVGHFFLMIGKAIKNLVPSQYTGVTDSKGNEIYEGDVIKYQYDSAYPDKFDMLVVEFEEFEPDKWGYQLGQGYGNVEVVGNIFENKELVI